MPKHKSASPIRTEADDDEMMSAVECCRFWGGDKPIHRATLDRWVRNGRVPGPIEITEHTLRYSRSQQVERREQLKRGEQ